MATTDLGKWMITNGGEYNPDTTYEQLTMVLYQNSTYITLRTVTGIIPNNDKINYILMAQGFSANALADVVAKDTYGVIGDVSGDVSAQNLVDYLTNEVVNNLLKKTSISTVQANSDNTVPSSSLAYAMQQEITKNKEDIATANSNLEELDNKVSLMYIRTPATITLPNRDMLLVCAKYDYISSASYAYHPENPIVTLYNNGFSSGAPSVAVSGNDITITFEKTYFHLFAIFPKVL